MTWRDKVFFSGVWILPLSAAATLMIGLAVKTVSGDSLSPLIGLAIVVIPIVIIGVINGLRYVSGERDFSPLWLRSPSAASRQKRKAMYTSVPKSMLSSEPDGFTIGRYRNRYVRIPIETDARSGAHNYNMLILGGPESLKTTIMLNLLLFYQWFAPPEERIAAFLIDRKPDITKRSFNQHNLHKLRIIRPTVSPTTSPGTDPGSIMDPLYGLNKESSDYEVLGRANLISRSLIIMPEDGHASYFYKNAQTLMSGIIMYGVYKDRSFIDIMLWIRTVPTDDIIAEILLDKEIIRKHPTILGLIRVFESDGKNESIKDIQTTLQTDTEIFLDERVRWQFGQNPNRVKPNVLDTGTSISVEIPDNVGRQFETLTTLFSELVIDCLRSMSESRRNRTGSPQIFLIFDEAGSYKIPSLVQALSIMRSRRVGIITIVQSLDQLRSPSMYGSHGTNVILDTCEQFVILSCHSLESARIFCEWAGFYDEKKVSVNSRGIVGTEVTTTKSLEHRKILEISDIMNLKYDRQALLFVGGKHYIIKKCPFFEIPQFLEKSKELEAINASMTQGGDEK